VKDVSCSADNRDTAIVFDAPFSDWLGLITNQGMVPAHAVAQLAGLPDANAIRAAYESNDTATLGKIADAWNTGFRTDQGLKPDVMLSGGPYKITEYVPDESVTLERNDKFWGTPGAADKVVFRIITDQSGLLPALLNSEVQVIAMPPDVDMLNELKSASHVTSSVNGGFTFEHFDFNFLNPLFQDKAVRQAVAYCIGRSELVDQLIKPLNDKAEVLQNRMFEPFQEEYVDNSGGEYDQADVAKARATLEAAGYTLNGNVFEKNGQKVEFTLLHKDTARRRSESQLISASCALAGISVLDDTDPNWSDRIGDGQFDAVVFASTGSPRLSANRSIYKTPSDEAGFNQNFGSYSNPEVDALMDTLATETDPAKRVSAANQADKLIWEDLGTIPLFPFPELVAFSDTISNVVNNPTQFGITWNDNEWLVD
jgi:peptide/nickel transport system substrate-binding protein